MSLESARASAFPEGFSASLNTRVPNILHFLSVSIKFPSTCPAHKLLWAMAQKWWFPVVRCLSQPLPISHLHTVFSVGCSPGSLVSCTPSTAPPPPTQHLHFLLLLLSILQSLQCLRDQSDSLYNMLLCIYLTFKYLNKMPMKGESLGKDEGRNVSASAHLILFSVRTKG